MAGEEDMFRANVYEAAQLLGYHVTHIESHNSSPGVPDLNVWNRHEDIWIELKVAKHGSIKLRPTQKRWHRDRSESMGTSYVCILVGNEVLTVYGNTAVTYSKVDDLRRYGINHPSIDKIMKECGYGKAKSDR